MSEDRVFAKCAWRLMPLIMLAYVVNYLDRTNVGMAALTMNRDLGFSPSVYGFGAGLFFASYALFQVPSNLMLRWVGARRGLFCILLGWGAVAAASALIRDPISFYSMRFLLGITEAGFFPGIILYLNGWFPKTWLVQTTAMFMSASVLALTIGGPVGGLILGLNGVAGVQGWQWLFLLEGLPACVIGFVLLKWLPDGPGQANWLSGQERHFIANQIQAESGKKDQNLARAMLDPRVLLLGIAYSGLIFAINGLIYWLPLLVQDMRFSNRATGFVVAAVWIAAVPVMILWGRSSDRRGERVWHVAIAALFAASALILAIMAQNDLIRLAALSAAAIGIEAVLSPFYGLPAQFLSGPAMTGGFALISSMGSLIGGFAGQYAIGVIREQTGGFAAVFVTLAAALMLTALIVLALGRSIAPRLLTVPVPAE